MGTETEMGAGGLEVGVGSEMGGGMGAATRDVTDVPTGGTSFDLASGA